MKKEKIIVEITYNSKGLVEIAVGDISLEIEAIRGKCIKEWFIPFRGRISWKGLIPEIKEAIQDDEAEFEFEFIGKKDDKKIFEECLEANGLISLKKNDLSKCKTFVDDNSNEGNQQENVQVTGDCDLISERESGLDKNAELLKIAQRLENQGKKKEALEQYMILAQQGHVVGEYKAAELRSEFLEEDGNKHSDFEKNQIFLLYEAAAKQGHAEAMKRLAECYVSEYGVDESDVDAAYWFEKAASAGNVEAMRRTGVCYEIGYGVEENKKVAEKWFAEGIKNNDAESGYHAGMLYLLGNGIDKDEKKAMKYFKKAAELGDAKAQYEYGLMLKGDNRIKWLKKSSDQELAEAQCELAIHYLKGDIVKKDLKQAITLLKKSAEQEDEYAIFRLGCCYYYGEGVKENNEEAFRLFSRAAKSGDVDAIFYLGECYYFGYGVGVDDVKAVDNYREAANLEHSKAQFRLGDCYRDGVGVKEDLETAIDWYFKSAENYNQYAQTALGRCYYFGYGVEENEVEAVRYFLSAAKQGNAEAQRFLGKCYGEGHGVEEDKVQAVSWYKKAAEQGDEEAQLSLGKYYSVGEGVEKNDEIAVEYYSKAAKQGNKEAKLGLGWHYAQGIGVSRDDEMAFSLFKDVGEEETENAEVIYAVANNYDYLLMPESIRKKINSQAKGGLVRTLAGAGALLVGCFVATPLMLAGGVLELSGLLGGKAKDKHYKQVLSTERGREMLAFYEKSANLGNNDAKGKVKELKKYM